MENYKNHLKIIIYKKSAGNYKYQISKSTGNCIIKNSLKKCGKLHNKNCQKKGREFELIEKQISAEDIIYTIFFLIFFM